MTGSARAIRIAILAMGGEGGGVLAQWIVDLAEHEGHVAQTTSVPGVAQRTGATVYYVELFPKTAIGARPPVLALMPVAGDVDLVLCSELMEAGRAIQRGFVTPDRTTLITATHRVYAMTERIALGDGRADAAALLEACGKAAKRLVALDLAAIAQKTGSVISAALLGALARSGELPFGRAAFEETIRRGGVGVAASLKAFAAAFEAADAKAPENAAPSPPVLDGQDTDAALAPPPAAAPASPPALTPLLARVAELPEPARAFARSGVERCADFQDAAYAGLYLDRLAPIVALERARGDGTFRLTREVARYLALGMAYEDTIRVADLKIRADRFARVRGEVGAREGQIVEIAEFLHPRLQEIAESVPARLGRVLAKNGLARTLVERLTRKGRVVRTTSVHGFALLLAVASLKPWRRSSLRYAAEQASLEDWLARIAALASRDEALAVELAECRNLVRGYGDTHARGSANYARILAHLGAIEARPDAAPTLASWRKAALADESGAALDRAIGASQNAPARVAAE